LFFQIHFPVGEAPPAADSHTRIFSSILLKGEWHEAQSGAVNNSYVDQAGKILLGEYGRQLGSLSNHRGNNADVLRVVSVCFVRPLTYLSRRNHRSFGRAKPTSANRSFGAQSNEYL
jgi:hypothetical protein